MGNENKVPRRARLDCAAPAEVAIYRAMQEIEKMDADVKLTNAIQLLSQAKDLVSDYIDESIKTE